MFAIASASLLTRSRIKKKASHRSASRSRWTAMGAEEEVRRPALKRPEAEESVTRGIETSPHVDREEEEGDYLGAQGSGRGSPHAEHWKAEFPEDQDVVQDDIGGRQESRRRDENPGASQAHQQRAVGERSAGETDAVRRDLQKAVDRDPDVFGLDEPGRQQG